MSTEQHDADAYGKELTRISKHQSDAVTARTTVFEALARAERLASTRAVEEWPPGTRKRRDHQLPEHQGGLACGADPRHVQRNPRSFRQ
jgi:hypothetical protein